MLHGEPNPVLFEENSCVRKVILNRPKKLNCLSYEMIVQILMKLEVYENDPAVKLVILKGNGKAFCAGGDVIAAINFIIMGHWSFGARFYQKLLTLNYVLGTYKKPLVSILNGTVIGGGAGISMHADLRIVTEKTVFAMPEASIGLFPDVGASHFLSRLPGFFGEYLGLTGARLDGTEMLACGLATHFVLSKDLDALESATLRVEYINGSSDVSTISKTLNKFVHKVHVKQGSPYSSLQMINQCFSKDTVEDILYSLNVAANQAEKWVIEAIKSMKSASPTSLKLSLRSIRKGRMQNFEECLVREYNASCHMMRRTINDDFFEGSRAMLIEKDKKPQWQPPKLELVSEEMVDQCFCKVDDDEWEPLELPLRSQKAFTLQSKL